MAACLTPWANQGATEVDLVGANGRRPGLARGVRTSKILVFAFSGLRIAEKILPFPLQIDWTRCLLLYIAVAPFAGSVD